VTMYASKLAREQRNVSSFPCEKTVIQSPYMMLELYIHIVLLGEPKSLLSEFKPSFGPLPWLAFPFNIGAKHRRAGWHGL